MLQRSSFPGLLLSAWLTLAACSDSDSGASDDGASATHPVPQPAHLFDPAIEWSSSSDTRVAVAAEIETLLQEDHVWIHDERLPAEFWKLMPSIPTAPTLALWHTHARFEIFGKGVKQNLPVAQLNFHIPGSHLDHPGLELKQASSVADFLDTENPPVTGTYLITRAGIAVARDLLEGPPDDRYLASYPTPTWRLRRDVPLLTPTASATELFPVTFERETRDVRFLPTPSSIRTRVALPSEPRLHLGFGLAPEDVRPVENGLSLARDSEAGATFTVTLTDESNQSHTLLERTLSAEVSSTFHDTALDLTPWGGQTVALELAALPTAEHPDRRNLALFSGPFLEDRSLPAEERQNPPNVLIILLDTLRADALGCYGNPRPLTPNLDALARAGTIFTNARSSCSWTLPAHCSLFSSLLPTEHGILDEKHALSNEVVTLAEVLRDAGYRTAAFTGAGFVSPSYGLAQGFDLFDFQAGGIDPVADRTLEWIDANPRPFFAFLHTYEVHMPYQPPEPFRSRFVRGLSSGEGVTALPDGPNPTPGQIRRLHDFYEAGVAYADDRLGKLFDDLDSRGLLDKTIVVVTSDHGEEFFEHHGWEHTRTLYEELLRIPLILRFPEGFANGDRIDDPVRLIDIAPTIIELTNAPLPETWTGSSLTKRGESRPLFAAVEFGKKDPKRAYATLEGTRKWIRTEEGFYQNRPKSADRELFDLSKDPRETRNLFDPALHEDHLRQLITGLFARFPRILTGDLDASTPSRDEQDHIKALGY